MSPGAGTSAIRWTFTGVLWLLRWLVIIPLNCVADAVVGIRGGASVESMRLPDHPLALLLLMVLLGPLLETLLECPLPYWVLRRVQKQVHRGLFIITSAMVMALLHPLWPMVIINVLITGAFIALVYAYNAPYGHGRAFLHAFAFHAGINLVGCILILAEIIEL